MEISQRFLKQRFEYDPLSGEFSRIGSDRKQAGTLTRQGYIRIFIKGKSYSAHRLIWLFVTGSMPQHDIDHIDSNRANNQWSNLREATRSQNLCNTAIRNSTSGVKGVHYCKHHKKWLARLRMDGIFVYREAFETLEDAAEAIKIHRERIHGAFAKHN